MWHILQKLEPLQEKLYNKLYATFESWVYWNQGKQESLFSLKNPCLQGAFKLVISHKLLLPWPKNEKQGGKRAKRGPGLSS